MKTRTKIIATSIIVIAIASIGVTVKNKNDASKNKILQVMMKSEPVTMNPIMTTDIYSEQVQDQVYEGLYRYEKNKIVPAMAENIVKPTKNGTVYTFKIRDNARWSNGDRVTANDFMTAIEKTADPKTKSQASADAISVIKNYDLVHSGKLAPDKIGVTAPDKQTVVVTLSQPTPWFDQLATTIIPVNTKKYQEWGQKYGTASKYMVTNGAYTMSNWTGTNTSFSLIKNSQYWHDKHVKINEIHTRVIKTPMTAAGEFKNKHLDIAQLSDEYIAAYKKNKDYRAVPQAVVRGIYFNETSSKTNNEHLRQAFGYMIDRDEIANHVMKDGSIAQSNAVPSGVMVNPTTGSDFNQDAGTQFKVNKKKAQAEWATYQKEIGRQSVTLSMTFDDDTTSKAVGAYIQYAAEQLFNGLTINMAYEPHGQVVSEVLKQNFDMVNMGLSVDVADATFPLVIGQTGYGLNFSKVSDATYDGLLKAANDQVTDASQRYKTLQAANKYFTQIKAYMIPIYQPMNASVVSDKIGGFKANAFHSAAYQDMYWKN